MNIIGEASPRRSILAENKRFLCATPRCKKHDFFNFFY
jgi:hypothetical protein